MPSPDMTNGTMDRTAFLRDGALNQKTGSYRSWTLAGGARLIIDLAWHSRIGYSSHERHQLLPFAEPSIAIRRSFAPCGATLDWDFVVFPARLDGGVYDPEPGEEIFALRLSPERMETQLGIPVCEYMVHTRYLPSSLSAQLEPVRYLADGDRFETAWKAMAYVLLKHAQDSAMDRLSYAAALLRCSGGGVSPAELAELAEISPRHLRRGFAQRFGLSPRDLTRRLRLTSALLEAERQKAPHWAEIAAGHRFADQAHLIRECQALVGSSPRNWHKLRRNLAVSFNT